MTKQITLAKDTLALLKSGGLKETQIKLINQPTPEQWVKKRKGRGGKEFDYVPVGVTIKCLNTVFGFNWSFEVVHQEILDGSKQVLVKGRLTIPAGKTQIVKETFASKEIAVYSSQPDAKGNKHPRAGEYISIGDDLKGATSLCLTKCASMLGFFSDIYSSEFYAKYEMPDGEDVKTTEDTIFTTTLKTIEMLKRQGKTEKLVEIVKKELKENTNLTDEQKKKLESYL